MGRDGYTDVVVWGKVITWGFRSRAVLDDEVQGANIKDFQKIMEVKIDD